jgi:ankyrin repeat protein
MDTTIEHILLDTIDDMVELINIERLIYGDNYIEINTKNEYFETPLILAAKCNRPDILELILANNNTNVNLQDIYGDTALHIAIRKGYNEIAKLLLHDWRTNINLQNKNREYVVHLVCYRGDPELYGLLESFRDLNIAVKDILGYTPFMYAVLKLHKIMSSNITIINNKSDIINSINNVSHIINSISNMRNISKVNSIITNLMDRGAIVEIPEILVDIGETWRYFINHPKFLVNSIIINKCDNLLSYSCRVNDVELLKALINNDKFAFISYLDSLETSIRNNNIEICLELFKYYNKDPEQIYLCDTLFRYIMDSDNLIKLLDSLLGEAKINISNILINAINHDKMDVLWNYEIDINTIDNHNNTLLHLSIKNNSPLWSIKKLIKLGVNPNFTNKYDKTALDYAISKACPQYINILMPVTKILDIQKIRLIDMYLIIKPELLIDIIVDIDFNNDIYTDTYLDILEFTVTLTPINKKRMIIGLLGSTCKYLELLVGYKNISIRDSHNTEDILTLDPFDISNSITLIQYGKAICDKYKTITLEALVGLVKNHMGTYMYELLDPFDRSNICVSKVYPTNNSILLELLLRLLI